MNDTEGIISDIYSSLVLMRYPKITTATVKHVESILLKGEDRSNFFIIMASDSKIGVSSN